MLKLDGIWKDVAAKGGWWDEGKKRGEGKERGIGKRLRWERMRPAQPDNLSGLQDHLSKD